MMSYFLWMSKESNFWRGNLLLVKILWRLLKWQKGFRILQISLVDEAVAGFEKIDSSFERSSTVGKVLSNSTSCCKEIIHERNNWCDKHHCCLMLRNCHSHSNLQRPTPCHHHGGKIFHQQKDYNFLKAQMMVSIFKQ